MPSERPGCQISLWQAAACPPNYLLQPVCFDESHARGAVFPAHDRGVISRTEESGDDGGFAVVRRNEVHGADSLNLPPVDVLPRLQAAGRTPLTIAEGLAVLVSDPGVLRGRNCFSLLGSRAGDKRVPALWVSDRRPRLGWCYQGAPHTWLGSASCAARLGEPRLG